MTPHRSPRRRAHPLTFEALEGRRLLATFTVTTPQDGVPGSLRAAIIASNAAPGADTILMPAGVYTLTIAGAGEEAAATGDLDITGDLTIQGDGAAITIIDGSGLDNVFQVRGPVTANFSGLSIRNALGGAAPGVGILAGPGNVNLAGVTLADNPGGAVKTYEGNVTATDSTILGMARGADGIYSSSGTVEVTRCTISHTHLGITTAGAVTVSGSVLSDNYVGAFTSAGNLTVSESTVTGNAYGVYPAGDVTMTNSVVSENTFAIETNGAATLTGSTVRGNGSGVRANGVASVYACRIIANHDYGITAYGAVTVVGSEVSENGGVGATSSRSVTVIASDVVRNLWGVISIDISASGSNVMSNTLGLYANRTLTVLGSNISGNGFGLECGGTVTATNSTVSGNEYGIRVPAAALSFVTVADNSRVGLSTENANVGNSIFAGNGTNFQLVQLSPGDSVGSIRSLGHNISSDHSDGRALTQPGDMVNTDPKLGPLADNGGFTLTRALLPGSPALDAGGPGGPATDQRGVAKPQGVAPDIGAFERLVLPPVAQAPRLVAVVRSGAHGRRPVLVLVFGSALDPATAQDVNNYRVVPAGARHGRAIPVRLAVYDPSALHVTLYLARRLNPHASYKLTVNGTTAGRLAGLTGLPLDGQGSGRPGSDYATVLRRSPGPDTRARALSGR